MDDPRVDETLENRKTLGREDTVKVLSELARQATTPVKALRYLRRLGDLEGWTKPRRRARQRTFDTRPKQGGTVRARKNLKGKARREL